MRALIVMLLPLLGCGSLPQPETAEGVRPRDYQVVDHPPPPARVEPVPARPTDTAVWVDGSWVWWRGRWSWVVGRWVEPPPGGRLQRWDLCWCDDGKLLYAPGVWRDDTGKVVLPPQPLALADPSRGAMINETGRRVEVGRNVRSRRRFLRRARRRHRREMRRRREASRDELRHHENCLKTASRPLR